MTDSAPDVAPEFHANLDRLSVSADGLLIEGWAAFLGSDARLRVEAHAGVVSAEATADIHRGDLEAAGFGDGRHGFSLLLPDTPTHDAAHLRITADGRALTPGAATTLEPALLRIWPPVARVENGRATGLSLDAGRLRIWSNAPEARFEVLLEGRPLWDGELEVPETAFVAGEPEEGRFVEIAIPEPDEPTELRTIDVIRDGAALPQSPLFLDHSAQFAGHVELIRRTGATTGVAKGWCARRAAQAGPVRLLVVHNDHVVGEGSAAGTRPDLVDAGYDAPDLVFSIPFTLEQADDADIVVRPATSTRPLEGPRRWISFTQAERLARELLIGEPEMVRGAVQTLYEQQDLDTLRELQSTLGPATGRPDLDGRLALALGRLALQRNLHGLGRRTLEALAAAPEPLAALDVEERHDVARLLVHAAVRTGAADRAVHDLSALARLQPTQWRHRFELGLLQGAADPAERRLQYRLALAMNPRAPFAETAVMLQAMLDDDRAEDALVETLRRVDGFAEEPELPLLLANIHLALGRPYDWAAYLNDYLTGQGLAGAAFDGEAAPGALLEALSYAASEPDGGVSGPLVTVIMPAFNAGDTIEHAMRSVLRQTHRNLRLVVVDDASTDDTRDRVHALAAMDGRVSLLAQAENRGPYAARNLALQTVESEFVTFHDADDWMHPERIARHLARMVEGGLAGTTSQWLRMTQDGNVTVRLAPGRHGYVSENPASIFIRREVLGEIGFFDDVRAAADSEFTYRLRRRYGPARSAALPQTLAVGLHRPGSITTSGSAALDAFRVSTPRNAYWESWMTWHDGAEPSELHLPFPHQPRRFPAPAELVTPS